MMIIEKIESPDIFGCPCQSCGQNGEFRVRTGMATIGANIANDEDVPTPTIPSIVVCLLCLLDLREAVERFKGLDIYAVSVSRGESGRKHVEIVMDE